MKKIIIVWLSLILATLSCVTNAQIIDQVSFTDIEPRPLLSSINETRSFTVNNSGEVGSLFFSGTITPIDAETTSSFAGDFAFNLSGPNIQINQIRFSQAGALTETISFEGSIQFTAPNTDGVIGSIEEGDILTFDFVDLFDDDLDSTNAIIDVTFEFSEERFVLEPFEVPELPEGIGQAIFTDILPSTPVNITEETRTFTATNSGTVDQLFFTGRITALDSGSFPSDFIVDIDGPNLSAGFIQLSTINVSFQTVLIEGLIDINGTISEGDNITFNFSDTFDDTFDDPNAIIDIAFVFLDESDSVDPTVSDLGSFTLDEGFYDRNLEEGINDHPYTTVEFEVSANGTYSIESIWGLDNFGGQFDGFLYIFDQPFDGVNDSNNIASNDDFVDISASRVDDLFLQQGVVYTALLTSFGSEADNNTLQGNLRVLSAAGNTASLIEEETELCFPIKSQDNNVVMICL